VGGVRLGRGDGGGGGEVGVDDDGEVKEGVGGVLGWWG